MRRWLLIALLFVLPLQMVWAAAAPYCAHEAKLSATKHFGHHEHEHQRGSESPDEARLPSRQNEQPQGHLRDSNEPRQQCHKPLRRPGLSKHANSAVNEPHRTCGHPFHDPDVKQRAILMFADQDPEGFFKFVEDTAAPVRALIRKAVQMNKLRKLGESIFWDKETLGGNEDQAVSYLLANKDKHDALKMLVKKMK